MATFTLVHVIISLIALATGFVVVGGMLTGRLFRGWTAIFLLTSIATNVTGFGFPFEKFLPSHGVAILSLILLAIAVYSLYSQKLAGKWQLVYVITAVASLYFNAFVLVAQLFLRLPALHELAPTQSEPPFAITQLLVLLAFLYLGVLTAKKFKAA